MLKLHFSTSLSKYSELETELAVVIFQGDRKIFKIDDPNVMAVINETRAHFAVKEIKRDHLITLSNTNKVRYLLLCSYDPVKYFTGDEATRIVAASLLGWAKDYAVTKMSILINDVDGPALCGPLMDGLMIGSYDFRKYFKENKDKDLKVEFVATTGGLRDIKRAIKSAMIINRGINDGRDCINEPGRVVTPESLADRARKIAKDHKLKCTVLDEKQLAKENYPGLIVVGQGSPNPPRLIVLNYTPKKAKKGLHLALVGKGITFDTGGYNIKTNPQMWLMKGDMGGGGAVLYAMQAIAQLKPAVKVTGIIAAAENVVSGRAQLPGNIFKAKNGKSIHVENTDAEGRLVLTDGLFRAGEEGATHIVDIATLTGSILRALGPGMAGMMGDAELIAALKNGVDATGEKLWEMPLAPEYRPYLDHVAADVNNVGGPEAGAILAGLFLKEFVPENTIWAHLDIAGPSYQKKAWKYYRCEGATGFGIRTLITLAMNATSLLTPAK